MINLVPSARNGYRTRFTPSESCCLQPEAPCRGIWSRMGSATHCSTGIPSGSKTLDPGSLTISGLHLTMLPFKKISFFTDKKEVRSSATALGYVAHAVSLIAFLII